MPSSDDPQRSAFRTSVLVSDFEGHIESVTHYSSRVVIGTSDGRLVMYDTRKGTNHAGASYTFDHRKPIEHILAVPHIRIVVVVSNGEISAHGATDLQLLPFDFSAANLDKVKLCCLNQRGPPHFRLGVATIKRRAILIYQYYSTEKCYKFLRQFATQDTPETMAWYRNKVVVGYRKDYFLLNDKSGESTPINAASIQQNASIQPLVKLLPKEEVLISALNRVGVFVGFTGEPLPKNSINWTHAPLAVEYTAPYLMGLVPRVGVEIHSMTDQSFVQLVPVRGVTSIFGNGMKWDMEPRPQGDPEDLVIVGVRDGATSTVLKVEPMPMEQQIGDLLDRGRVDEAHEIIKKSLTGLPSDKQRSKLKRFQRQATVALLRRLEFDAAMEYMYRSSMDPMEFLAFFPDFQCASFAHEPLILKPEVLPRGSSVSPNISSVITEILATMSTSLAPEIVNSDTKKLVYAASKALMKFLEMYKRHVREKSSKALASSSSSSSSIPSRVRSVSGSSASSSSSSAAAKDPRRAEAIDTALFRLYVAHKRSKELNALIEDSEMEASSLDLSSCHALLLKHHLYYEAGQLLRVHGKYKDALDVYAALYTGEFTQTPIPKEPVRAAVDLLISLGDDDEHLIFEESAWIIEASPLESLRIFTERKPAPSSNDVTEHLKKCSNDPTIVQKYLETLVKSDRQHHVSSASSAELLGVKDNYSNFLGGDAEAALPRSHEVDSHHTRLALEYLEEVLQLVKQGATPSKSHPGKEAGPLGDARKRLLKFLKSGSSNFDVGPLVEKVKHSPLYNEFVILCGRGGLHEQALHSLLYELHDIKGAESYCLKYGVTPGWEEAAAARRGASGVEIGKGVDPNQNAALLALLKMCFQPQEDSKKAALNDFAFQLLNRHGKRMDGKQVLALLPSSTPLHKLMEYLSLVLPNSAHNVREMHLSKSLSNIYNLQVQCERVEKLSQHVEIDPNTVCFSCKKRIGEIVFAVYPNGNVVHYNCTNGRLDVCPITGERFE